MTQWTQVWPGASGSSTMRAKYLVPLGGFFQFTSGEILPLPQVYLSGIMPPSLKEVLRNSMPVFFLGVAPRVEKPDTQSKATAAKPHKTAEMNFVIRASLIGH